MNSSLKMLCYLLPVLILFSFARMAFFAFGSQISTEASTTESVGDGSGYIRLAQSGNKYSAGGMTGVSSDLDVKLVSATAYESMIDAAVKHPRKRKMTDLTKDPPTNSLQNLINTWTNGSYSPVHMHDSYSEAFVVLKGALAFFVFDDKGSVTCNILHDQELFSKSKCSGGQQSCPNTGSAIIVEKRQWHAMTAAPPELGWPGYAIIFENSGHLYDPKSPSKVLAPFAPVFGDGLNGDPVYFASILRNCPRYSPK